MQLHYVFKFHIILTISVAQWENISTEELRLYPVFIAKHFRRKYFSRPKDYGCDAVEYGMRIVLNEVLAQFFGYFFLMEIFR